MNKNSTARVTRTAARFSVPVSERRVKVSKSLSPLDVEPGPISASIVDALEAILREEDSAS
jgi:hypothetical protein